MAEYATFEEELDAIRDALYEEEKNMTLKERLIKSHFSTEALFRELNINVKRGHPTNPATGKPYTKEEYEEYLFNMEDGPTLLELQEQFDRLIPTGKY